MRNNFLIILSSIFFIFSLQNYSYSQTPKPLDSTNSIEHPFTLFGVKLDSNLSTVPNIKKFIQRDGMVTGASFTPKLKNELINNYYVYFYPFSKTIYRIEGESKQTYRFDLYSDKCNTLELYSAYKYLQEKIVKESQGAITGKNMGPGMFLFEKKKVVNVKYKGQTETADLYYKCERVDSTSSPIQFQGIIILDNHDGNKDFEERELTKANQSKQKEKDLKESGKFKNF